MRELLLSPPAKFGAALDRDVFVYTKAAYARNLDGPVFPRKATPPEAEETRARILDALGEGFSVSLMEDADGARTEALIERGLMDGAEADEPSGPFFRACALSSDGVESCFVNGTDHLRLSVRGSGLSVDEVFRRLREREVDLDRRLNFAASLQYGYLSSRPEDCGSGLSLSASAFLPGILAAGVFDRVVRDLLASGVEPRVIAEEKPEGEGDPYSGAAARSPFIELRARAPLGTDESAFIGGFASAMRSLSEGERKTRLRVLARERVRLEDAAFRAAAVLRSARLLSFPEALRLFAALRSGIVFGVAPPSDPAADPYDAVDALITLAAPGHIRLRAKEKSASGYDETRADLVRGLLPHYLIG